MKVADYILSITNRIGFENEADEKSKHRMTKNSINTCGSNTFTPSLYMKSSGNILKR